LIAQNEVSSGLDTLVAQYVGGELGHGMSVLMASYLTLSPEARQDVAALEKINGALLEEAEPADMNADALDQLMARLDEPEAPIAPKQTSATSALNDDLPAPLRAFLAKPIEQARWRFAYPGVRHMELPIGDAGETVKLLKIKPGKAAPRHTHNGMEATLVLRGAFRDGERVYERGELAVADHDVQHRPRAEGEEDCICLAVTDGALRFTDTLGRMARDFFTL
jgi:putative transcriptional regulator